MSRRTILAISTAAVVACAALAWLAVWFFGQDPEMHDLGTRLSERLVGSNDASPERACARLFEYQRAADAAGTESFTGIDWSSSTGRSAFIDGCVDGLRDQR